MIVVTSLPVGTIPGSSTGSASSTEPAKACQDRDTASTVLQHIPRVSLAAPQCQHCPHNNPSCEPPSLARAAPWAFTYRGSQGHPATPPLPSGRAKHPLAQLACHAALALLWDAEKNLCMPRGTETRFTPSSAGRRPARTSSNDSSSGLQTLASSLCPAAPDPTPPVFSLPVSLHLAGALPAGC